MNYQHENAKCIFFSLIRCDSLLPNVEDNNDSKVVEMLMLALLRVFRPCWGNTECAISILRYLKQLE